MAKNDTETLKLQARIKAKLYGPKFSVRIVSVVVNVSFSVNDDCRYTMHVSIGNLLIYQNQRQFFDAMTEEVLKTFMTAPGFLSIRGAASQLIPLIMQQP